MTKHGECAINLACSFFINSYFLSCQLNKQLRKMNFKYILLILTAILQQHCTPAKIVTPPIAAQNTQLPIPKIQVGAEQMSDYLPMLAGKKVGVVVNQTSMVGSTHLVDSLLIRGIQIARVFAPEHGFRGKADAGAKIKDGIDEKTGLPITSLYGKKRKPGVEEFQGIDIILFDIQDVGVRCYTYISTMTLVMEACAEQGLPFIILDRPNPNGHYIDGPMLDTSLRSFVGQNETPLVYGMTEGELAKMIIGEKWINQADKLNFTLIPCVNYTHHTIYELPIKPSPNLPNLRSIYLYPSLVLVEGTTVSAGRGTNQQFQVIGHPDFTKGDYTFTPTPRDGAWYPKHKGKVCHGYNLTTIPLENFQKNAHLRLDIIMNFYRDFPDKNNFFIDNNFFDKLAGTKDLKQQIIQGKSEAEIRTSWQPGLNEFKKKRKKYLMYMD